MFDQRFPSMPPATRMPLPSGAATTGAEAQALFQNPGIMQAILGHFMRQQGGQGGPGMPQVRPAQVPQVVQPGLDSGPQQPMGMNPMLARIMQRFGQPGGVRAATGAGMTGAEGAVPADVMMTQPM